MALVVLGVLGVRTLWRAWSAGSARPISPPRRGGVVVSGLAAVSAARGLDYRDPVGIWQSVVDVRPHGRAEHNLGIALAARGREDEALSHYRAAAATLPEARYSLGFLLASRGDDAAAVVELREFLTRKPDDVLAPLATNLLGMVLTRQPGAVAAFERTLGMRPQDADARRGLAEALTDLGATLAGQGRLGAAADAFARSATVAPDAPGAYLNHGAMLMQLGRASEAEAVFRRGLAVAPAHVPLGNALAAALATRGARDEAIVEFTRVLALSRATPRPRPACACCSAGAVRARAGERCWRSSGVSTACPDAHAGAAPVNVVVASTKLIGLPNGSRA